MQTKVVFLSIKLQKVTLLGYSEIPLNYNSKKAMGI